MENEVQGDRFWRSGNRVHPLDHHRRSAGLQILIDKERNRPVHLTRDWSDMERIVDLCMAVGIPKRLPRRRRLHQPYPTIARIVATPQAA